MYERMLDKKKQPELEETRQYIGEKSGIFLLDIRVEIMAAGCIIGYLPKKTYVM